MSLEDWRRIYIDQYDADTQYVADELPEGNSTATVSDMQALSTKLRGLIQRMDIGEAFKTSIEFAPYGAGEDVCDAFLRGVFEIFTNVKMNDIPNIVTSLDLDVLDVVVKYIYTLMGKEFALKQSGLLLVWLDRIVDKVGEGPIIRYLSDPYKL
ncbi:hypothetical protein CAS74_002315 [Pichia kudriavzevii]|uniref:Actin-related protein 2/3 complex subunit 5 n=1 Tax=Pichia kudriavzevii TaxID=4909 RepID=A0A1Z8JPN2_PICKU|nr:hypothetical protein CAS74_002315 [Pichia kudriavzevii]